MPDPRHGMRGSGAIFALIASTCFAHEPPDSLKHPAAIDPSRFVTDRSVAPLPLPAEEDAFFFVVFGDRTGGAPEGVEVLADAVRETNLLEPDLVMTVGDLVEGYNTTDEWLVQMREFKRIMDRLHCPWFPVAGNHDIYWRGSDKPVGEHETNFETHFGPLWYAFEHKDCWFIVLYSDEGNPMTGEKSIDHPASQAMSEAQLKWLDSTLVRSKDAAHVFVFVHHPRWLRGKYGHDWDRVHRSLAAAGNVRAVFAGHIHRMRYDGPEDGIEYVTLATTGGTQQGFSPKAGYVDHYDIVTVRPDRIGLTSVPVGEVMDVRAVTGELSSGIARIAGTRPEMNELRVSSTGRVDGVLNATFTNKAKHPIDVTLLPETADPRWHFSPDHAHQRLEPGHAYQFSFGVCRDGSGINGSFEAPRIVQKVDVLARRVRYPVIDKSTTVPLIPELSRPEPAAAEQVLRLDGVDGYLSVPNDLIQVPDGPMTVECWFRAREYRSSAGLVAKTERSDYGIFVGGGVPSFSIYFGHAYCSVEPEDLVLETGRWYHVAGVYDGTTCRLYVDGRLVGETTGAGTRRKNELPCLIGADVNGAGRGTALFNGDVGPVRISTVARYEGERVEVHRRFQPDGDTTLLLNMDTQIGPWAYDESGHGAHAFMVGNATFVPVQTATVPFARTTPP